MAAGRACDIVSRVYRTIVGAFFAPRSLRAADHVCIIYARRAAVACP